MDSAHSLARNYTIHLPAAFPRCRGGKAQSQTGAQGENGASPRQGVPSPQASRGHGFSAAHKVRMNEEIRQGRRQK